MNVLFLSLHHFTGIVIVLNRNLLFPFAIQAQVGYPSIVHIIRFFNFKFHVIPSPPLYPFLLN